MCSRRPEDSRQEAITELPEKGDISLDNSGGYRVESNGYSYELLLLYH